MEVPNSLLGRVASIEELRTYALPPLGYALAGWATTALGAQAVFIFGGLATAGCMLYAATHPAAGRYD